MSVFVSGYESLLHVLRTDNRSKSKYVPVIKHSVMSNLGASMRILQYKQLLLSTSMAITAMSLSGCGGSGNDNEIIGGSLANPPAPTSARFELVWSDEFDGASLDTTKWDIQLGDGSSEGIPGWGNNELQYYTADNISLVDGNLVITARVGDSPDPNFDFTSARIRTQGKFDFTYGRVEASIKMPEGLGLWGAFWMLGSDPSPFGAWAARGEIDIVESFGQVTQFAQGAAHFGMQFPLNETVHKIRDDVDPTDGFHQYAIEWDSEQIRYFIDGDHYFTIKAETYWNYFYEDRTQGFISGGDNAPFNADQHILLNLAVGGNPAGVPNASDTEVFPGEMLVEYVRVYQCPLDANTGLGCEDSIDQVDPFVITQGGDGTPPPQDVARVVYDLYTDALGTLFAGTNGERPLGFGVFDNDGALALTEVEVAERGMVIDVLSTGGGNISINDPNQTTFELFGMGSATDPAFFGGELKFDVRVISGDDTDASGALQVKMDSGFPDVGFLELPLSTIPADEWTTISLRLSEVIRGGIGTFGGGPLDITEVLNLIVFEPTSKAHLQFDNVQLVCGAPESRPCGIVTVPTVPQNVFIDQVDELWTVGIGASDSGSGFQDYTDGTNPNGTNKVEWRELADEDTARGQVIEVTFNDSAETGVWFIQSRDVVNLAGYGDGAVVFDLKVIDYGNNTSGMTMKIDCVFPCTSGDQALGVVADGEWETIEIPVAQLVDGGLSLSSVNTGIVLLPTSQSGDITFRVDNIRWEPTTTVVIGPAPMLSYSADFEASDPAAGTIGDGWTSFASVFDADGNFLYNYGTFDTPNGTNAFAGIASGEGGPAQGNQHLSIFSDYNNGDHGNSLIIETLSFQERTLTEQDSGNYRFTFDAKAPNDGGIAPPSTALAFVKVLDPNAGFSTTINVELDLSNVTSADWTTYSLDINLDGAALAGQVLQFGFQTRATDFNPSAILYDNLDFNLAAGGISYTTDFETSNASAGTIGDGWTSFASVFDADGNFVYNYGTFDTPNNTGGFASIATGEEGPAQGTQYLNVFSDYNNADHGNGLTIQALTFQERTITAADGGTYRLSFDARAPMTGGIAAPTTAFVFIKTLDPATGFATTTNVELDMSSVSNTEWASFTLDLAIDAAALENQLLQFGFSNSATGFNPSGIYYDNIEFGLLP